MAKPCLYCNFEMEDHEDVCGECGREAPPEFQQFLGKYVKKYYDHVEGSKISKISLIAIGITWGAVVVFFGYIAFIF